MVGRSISSKLMAANFHLRPHLDHQAPPSAIFLPAREQTLVLWGFLTGSCVHTTVLSRHHATHGGRAASLNVQCNPFDAHEGEVRDIWTPETTGATIRWVTAGADGRVKYWQLHPGQNAKSGKRSPAFENESGSITCLFTSSVVDVPLSNRSDGVKRRQNAAPDAVILARCDIEHDVVSGVTEDGDLRLWSDASTTDRREVRLDVGSQEVFGGVKRLELDVQDLSSGLVTSIFIHHNRASTFNRYDVKDTRGSATSVSVRTFASSDNSPLTSLYTCLNPTPPISSQPRPLPALSVQIAPAENIGAASSPPSPGGDPGRKWSRFADQYGRFVVGGDLSGTCHVWAWDADAEDTKPLRSWQAVPGKVTAMDVSCGLVGVGRYVVASSCDVISDVCSFDGYIMIYDPLPTPPTLLPRSTHPTCHQRML